MKKKRILPAAIFLICLVAFQQMTLTGTWVGRIAVPNSTDSASIAYMFEQNGATLTGTMTPPEGIAIDIDSGKVAGNIFSFDLLGPNGEVKVKGMNYGDSLGSDVTLPNGKLIHFTSVRAK